MALDKPDAKRLTALGLDFDVVPAGSRDLLFAELDAAYDKHEPIILYNWTLSFLDEKYDGSFVEFPEWEQACDTDPGWGINPDLTHDCGYRLEHVKTGVSTLFPEQWPEAAAIVRRVNFTNVMIGEMAALVDVDGLSESEAAETWLVENEDLWRSWISG